MKNKPNYHEFAKSIIQKLSQFAVFIYGMIGLVMLDLILDPLDTLNSKILLFISMAILLLIESGRKPFFSKLGMMAGYLSLVWMLRHLAVI